MKTIYSLLGGILIGGSIVFALVKYTTHYQDTHVSSSDSHSVSKSVPEPLYWVAPMDANFRRDKPGKSPMGMDLVPVYADSASSEMDSVGLVKIAPNVVNNIGVRTAQVKRQSLSQPIQAVGYIQYNQDTLVHIHPRVEGWVDKLYVKAAGDKVEKGQALYALYSPQLVNAQEEYLLAAKRQNQNLIAAALERLIALQMPAAGVERLKRSGKVMQTVEFVAPQTGVVDNLNIREGFFVKPGTTMMSIGALEQVWLEVEVFERQAAQVKVGQLVTMTMGFIPGREWPGKVDYIYPTLDESTRTLRLRLRFDNNERLLKPNMFATVVIHSEVNQATLVVPTEAVIRTGTQDRVVMDLGQGKFKSVEVKLGLVTQDYAEILNGLKEGDSVVSSAQFLIDSESSINSDFLRLQVREEADVAMDHSMASHDNMPVQIESAMVEGVVNQINKDTINISRGPIEKWGRGPATLDFVIDSTISPMGVAVGDTLNFTFEIRDGEFVIVAYEVVKS